MKNTFIVSVWFIIIGLVGLVTSVVCYEEAYITSTLSYHDAAVYSTYAPKIVEDSSVWGMFKATSDNLATVKLRIRTYARMNTTHVQFRIREKGMNSWLATNVYVTDRFPDGLLYPFGFPPIPDSRGKVYEYELTSSDGESDNAIGVYNGYHDVASVYSYKKNALLRSMPLLKEFLLEKIRGSIFDLYFIIYILLFLIPALAFGTRRLMKSKDYFRVIPITYCVVAYLIYSYLPVAMHSNTVLFVAAVVAYVYYLWNLRPEIIFAMAIVGLIQIPITLLFGNILAASRIAMIVYHLIIIGVIGSVFELRKK